MLLSKQVDSSGRHWTSGATFEDLSDTQQFCGLHVKTQWGCCCLLIALLLHFNISSLVRTWSILTYLLLHSTFYVCIWTFFIFLHVNSIKNIHWRRWLYKSLKPLNYCENVGWCVPKDHEYYSYYHLLLFTITVKHTLPYCLRTSWLIIIYITYKDE